MKKTLLYLKPILPNPGHYLNVDDFFIQLNNPHQVFAPGDKVEGTVVVVVRKPCLLSDIVCTIQGTITIRNALVKGKSAKHILFEDKILLWGVEKDLVETKSKSRKGHSDSSSSSSSNDSIAPQSLQRGEHNFAFEFVLPSKGLYNSLEFERGSISYVISALCHRPGPSPAQICKKSLSVICPIDVSQLPPAKTSFINVEVRKKRKQFGSITVSVQLPQKGYLRGENVPLRIAVNHIKTIREPSGVVATLSRISRVTAHQFEAQSFRKDLAQTISPLYTDPVTYTSVISTNIRIPPESFPTTKGHESISFQYCIEVVLDLAGKWDLQTMDPDHQMAGFIETERLKKSRGVVSLWTEIVIGTTRSLPLSKRAMSVSSSFNESTSFRPDITGGGSFVSSSSSPIDQGSQQSTAQSQRLLAVNNAERSYSPSQSTSSSLCNFEVLRTVDAMHAATPPDSEKERLRLREQALLPSAPPLSEESAPNYSPASGGDSSSAPPQDLAVALSNISVSNGNLATTHEVHSSSDKLEFEQQRLRELASRPEETLDYVPSYEQAPNNSSFVPILPDNLFAMNMNATAPPAPVLTNIVDDVEDSSSPTPKENFAHDEARKKEVSSTNLEENTTSSISNNNSSTPAQQPINAIENESVSCTMHMPSNPILDENDDDDIYDSSAPPLETLNLRTS